METFEVLRRDENEIIFKSTEELKSFFEEINNGSWTIIEYEENGILHGEVISPDISAKIKDNKFFIKSEQEVK